MAKCIKELTVTPAVLLGCRSFSIEASMAAQIRAPGGLQKDLRTPPHPPCPPSPTCFSMLLQHDARDEALHSFLTSAELGLLLPTTTLSNKQLSETQCLKDHSRVLSSA